MTVAPTAAAPERELQDLYARSKTLTLAAAAALMLDSGADRLSAEAERLLDDCLAARRRSSMLRPQLSACVDAARELRRLLDGAAEGTASDVDLERARTAHRRLRREVWRVLPCEYVPCCAAGHAHDER
jgi:hypothetical protein